MSFVGELLERSTLFLFVAHPSQIAEELHDLELKHNCKLTIFSIEHPTMSGARCTRVTWKKV